MCLRVKGHNYARRIVFRVAIIYVHIGLKKYSDKDLGYDKFDNLTKYDNWAIDTDKNVETCIDAFFYKVKFVCN